MIDKIRLETHYQQYGQHAIPKTDAKIGSFSLDHDPGVVYEPSRKKAREETQDLEEKKNPVIKNESVTLELSSNKTAVPEHENVHSLSEVIHMVVDTIRNFVSDIWNGGQPNPSDSSVSSSKDVVEKEVVQVTEKSDAEEKSLDVQYMDELAKSHNIERLERVLTGNGTIRPARNTDLLTSYNRHGKIVAMDASDKRKILQGKYGDIEL